MPKVTELRPLCPVTLTLKDGSVFTWDEGSRGFWCPEGKVYIWPAGAYEWGCGAGLVIKWGIGPQEAFDAMVAKARAGLAAVRDGKEEE